MNVSNLAGKWVLVTGAASGIGRETALAFARRGADVAICDLNEAGLSAVTAEIEALGRRVVSRRVDVSKLPEMEAFAVDVHGATEAIDILVNNAGVGLGGGFLETEIEDWEWVIGINLWGVIHGCHCFVPKMVARKRGGHVVNVSSAAGYVASEPLSAYSTTKFAVLGLSEALRDELAPHGIGVTAICPGIINTPITGTARLRGRAAEPGAREKMAAFYRRRNYGPERVAKNIVKAVARNAAVAPVSPEAWMLYYLKRFVPASVARINRRLAQRMERDAARRRGAL